MHSIHIFISQTQQQPRAIELLHINRSTEEIEIYCIEFYQIMYFIAVIIQMWLLMSFFQFKAKANYCYCYSSILDVLFFIIWLEERRMVVLLESMKHRSLFIIKPQNYYGIKTYTEYITFTLSPALLVTSFLFSPFANTYHTYFTIFSNGPIFH